MGHFISFAVVPVHWRVLYINIVSIGFGTILSQVANLPPPGASVRAHTPSAAIPVCCAAQPAFRYLPRKMGAR